MKSLLALTAALVSLGAVTAQAGPYDRWERDRFPYEARHHAVCQAKAHRLFELERRADDRRDFRVVEQLRHDLRETCGGFRWRS